MPKDPIQSIVTRAIDLNRYSNKVSNDILALQNRVWVDTLNQLQNLSPGQESTYNAQRLRGILKQTRETIRSAGAAGEAILIEQMQGLAESEVKFIQKQMALAIKGGTIGGRKIGKTLSATEIPASVVINTVEVPPNFARVLVNQSPSDIPLVLKRENAKTLAQDAIDAPVTLNLRTPLGTELAATLDGTPIVKRFRALTESSADLFDSQIMIGLSQGQTISQIQNRLLGKISYVGDRTFLQKGAMIEAKNAQIRALVRTSVTNVNNVASQSVYQANQQVTKKYKFVATLDSRSCPTCGAYDQKTFNYGAGPTPAIHFNCLTEDSLVSPIGRVAAVFKRAYQGFVYRITTATNHSFTCTPNHPILTIDGWVAAEFLEEGSNIIRYVVSEGANLIKGQDHQVKTTIKDFASAFGKEFGVMSCKVPMSAPDFHCDGTEGEVAVVTFDGKLWDEINPSVAHHFIESKLKIATEAGSPSLIRLSSQDGTLDTARPSPHGFMGFASKSKPLFGGKPSHSAELLLGLVSNMNPSVLKESSNDIPANAKAISDARYPDPFTVKSFDRDSIKPDFSFSGVCNCRLFGLGSLFYPVSLQYEINGSATNPEFSFNHIDRIPSVVSGDDCINRKVATKASVGLLSLVSDVDAIGDENPPDRHRMDADLLTDIQKAIPGSIEIDYVTSIERIEYSGHVYNLETESGMYCADSIITHNCRCTTVAEIDYKALGITPPEDSTRASADGQVPASLDYEDWLKKQPRADVEKILSKGKGDLFLANKIRIADIVRTDTSEVSLAQLQKSVETKSARVAKTKNDAMQEPGQKVEGKQSRSSEITHTNLIKNGRSFIKDELKQLDSHTDLIERIKKANTITDEKMKIFQATKDPKDWSNFHDEYTKLRDAKERLSFLQTPVMEAIQEKLKSEFSESSARAIVEKIEYDSKASKSYNKTKAQSAMSEFFQLTQGKGAKVLDTITKTDSRPHAQTFFGTINIGKKDSQESLKSTLFHEMGHFLETDDERIFDAAKAWVKSRATGERQPLGGNYDKDETAYPDKFIDPYVGKVYADGTEVISMGMEHFTDARKMLDFYQKDPEHFNLIVGVLRVKN